MPVTVLGRTVSSGMRSSAFLVSCLARVRRATPVRAAIFAALAIGLFCFGGCRPAVESSDQATALPSATKDPAEDGVDADRWPGWRGHNASGIAPAGSPAVHFSSTAGYRWKTAVPGEGNSSPVVWDDKIFLTTALDRTDPPTLAVLCFDRRNGRIVWQVEAGAAEGRTHAKNGYASASVATDGKRLFAFFGSTGLFCYDLAGNELWRAELGDLDHIWGTAASPVLYGDTVIQLCDSGKDSYLAAFDKSTGDELWRTPRPSSGCWTTPVLVEATADDGSTRTELVVNGCATRGSEGRLVIAYDPTDGRELWRVEGTTELVTPTAVVGDGLVFSMSGRNGPIMAIRPGGSGDVTGSRVVWKIRRGGPYIPTGLCYRNRLYVPGDAGQITCYNAGSGETVWSHRFHGVVTASLVAADGRIYAVDERGAVYVFAAGDRFDLLAENAMDARCLATPAIAGGDLLIRTESDLFLIPGQRDGG